MLPDDSEEDDLFREESMLRKIIEIDETACNGCGLCVADLAELIGATQSAVSHQLRTLKQVRLVKFQRDGKNVIYSLSDDHVYTMLAQGMTHICE